MNIIKNARENSRIFYYLFYYYYLTIVTINVAIEIIVPTNENAGGKVLRQALGAEAAHFFQRGTEQHGVGAAENHRIGLIPGRLQAAVEIILLIGDIFLRPEDPLEQVGISELLRCLDIAHLAGYPAVPPLPRLTHKTGYGFQKELRFGTHIRVEHRDQG